MERDYAEIEELGPGLDVLCFQIYTTLNERMGTWTRKFFSYSPYEILRVDRYKYDGPNQHVYKAEGFNIDHINFLGERGCRNVNEIAQSFAIVREWDKSQDRGWHWAAHQMWPTAYLSTVYDEWHRIYESEVLYEDNYLARILKRVTEGKMLDI
jgi:hypothetical protein